MGRYWDDCLYADDPQSEDYLEHYGTPGMNWGVRRYQYEDGSLTPEGRIHYGVGAAANQMAVDKNNAKIRKIRSSRSYQKASIKAKGLRAKASEYAVGANTARQKEHLGARLDRRDEKNLKKYNELSAKAERQEGKVAKKEAKIQKIEYRNQKYQKEIDAAISMYGKEPIGEYESDIEFGKEYWNKAKRNTAIATILFGPIPGAAAYVVTGKKMQNDRIDEMYTNPKYNRKDHEESRID